MKNLFKAILAIALGAATWGALTSTVSANGQYSAARSNSVRLVWRANMGRYAYTASTGARYSKHLGNRYGYNSSNKNVILYTDAHEKLYQKAKHNYAIYYHVKSTDGKVAGWIWRGYLRAAKATSTTTTPTSTNTGSSSTGTVGYSNGKSAASVLKNWQPDWLRLFPGTIPDVELSGASKTLLYLDNYPGPDGPAAMERWLTGIVPFKQVVAIRISSKTPSTEATIEEGLVKAGYSADARSKFSGWHIGANLVEPDAVLEGVIPGDAIIYLTKN